MPIYAYKCGSCGHARDVLQKLSDAPLTECPACGAPAFSKQVTAAGFQLKGSGWYATDFRNGSKAPAPAADDGEACRWRQARGGRQDLGNGKARRRRRQAIGKQYAGSQAGCARRFGRTLRQRFRLT
jgi:putative FmdB family regulatory protein